IADHQPEVAVGREHALPFTPEAHCQVVRVTLGRRTPPPSHPVRRRGQDHPDAPRRDRMEAVAVPAEQAQPPIAALVAGHGERTKSRDTVNTKSARLVYMLVRKSWTMAIVRSGRFSQSGGPQPLMLFW